MIIHDKVHGQNDKRSHSYQLSDNEGCIVILTPQLFTMKDHHPLESLSLAEIELAVQVLKKQNEKVTSTTRFVSVTLREPAKEKVINRTIESIPREADVILFDNGTNSCYEACVSLEDEGRILSFEHIPGVQPTMTVDEQVECEQAVLRSVQFQELIREHYGINDVNLVMVDIWSSGYYGKAEEGTRRLARPLCFARSDPTDNGYAHPIEGLRPVVDLNSSTRNFSEKKSCFVFLSGSYSC
jgi:primary-amine oxidase